jgi:hypothetical protein
MFAGGCRGGAREPAPPRAYDEGRPAAGWPFQNLGFVNQPETAAASSRVKNQRALIQLYVVERVKTFRHLFEIRKAKGFRLRVPDVARRDEH